MKTRTRFIILLALLVAIAIPSTAFAKGLYQDKVIFGESFTLQSGDTLHGNLVVFGGNAILEEESRVTGDVVIIGGTVSADGSIGGNLVAVGGIADLGETADVSGDIVLVGGEVDRAIGASVNGNIINPFSGPFSFTLPEGVPVPVPFQFPSEYQAPWSGFGFSPVFDLAWFILRTLMWAVLAIVLVIFLEKPMDRTGSAAMKQPLLAIGLGLLTAILVPPVMVILAITICLIPVAILLGIALAIAWAFGMIALGFEVGKRMAKAFNTEWAPAVSAGLGTFVLILVVNGVGEIVPCVGWIVPFLVGLFGFGAVLLTRFGSQEYPPAPEFVEVASSEEFVDFEEIPSEVEDEEQEDAVEEPAISEDEGGESSE